MLKKLYLLPLAALALSVVAAPACASRTFYRYPASTRVDARAYDRGFDEGRHEGLNDARHNRRYDYARHRQYENADVGFRGGDRFAYGREFRQGFVAGYNEGYRSISVRR